MPEPQRRDRLFRILITSVAVFTSGAILAGGWQVYAADAPEPRWMVRFTAAGMLAGFILAGVAAYVLFRERDRRG
jgi:hypothetical protein